MKTRFDAPRPLTNQTAVTGPEGPDKAQTPTEGLKTPDLPASGGAKLPGLPLLRTLSTAAAAALMALNVGFAQRAQTPETRTSRLGTDLPAQRGAPALAMDAPGSQDVRLLSAKGQVDRRIQTLALGAAPTFRAMLGQVFGARATGPKSQAVLKALQSGHSLFPGRLQVVPAVALSGADGAYDAAAGRILVSAAVLGQPARLQAVLLEELGHHIDAQLGAGDAVGDEGQLFRLAVQRGRLLSQPELQSGRLDRDHRTIELDGQQVQVELSTRAEDRAYEVEGRFSDADVSRGVEARLALEVDHEVVARASAEDPTARDLEQAKAHFGDGYAEARAGARAAIVGEDEAAYLGALGEALIKEAVTSSVVVRFKEGGILPEETTLATALPPRTQARVEADEALAGQKISTWGGLARALAGDVDADGKLDFDAFTFQRFLPDVSAQDILRATQKPLTPTQMREKLHAVGFDSPMLEGFSIAAALELVPPKLFGLEGRTKIDKTQQQLLLRTGRLFIDSNDNQKIDDGDAVHFVDTDGTVKESTYGELSSDLKKLVQLNLATAKVAEEYAGLPSHRRMRFPHYEASTGKPGDEIVNEDFWTISTAKANRDQISWELKGDRPVRNIDDVKSFLSAKGEEYDKVFTAKKDALGEGASVADVEIALLQDHRGEQVKGHRPSEALDDVFVGNGGKYTTECAHGRTLIRLQGLQRYYRESFGEGLGAYKFDMLFAKTPADKQRATDYVAGFEAHRAANEGATWDDYVAANPVPSVAYAMEVSRHRVFGNNESVVEPFKRQKMGAAGGDTGYFHNYSVSVEGVRIGYVGENVIDLGYKGGVRRYWGHPGGIQNEKSWQGELASRRIKVHGMGEFAQYFSHVDTKRGSERVTKLRTREIDKQIRELKIDQPAGYEARIEDLQGSKGWWLALDMARKALVDHLDRDQLEAADKLFTGRLSLVDPSEAGAIFDLLTAEGRTKAASAFADLPKDTRSDAVRHFGVAAEGELDEAQQAKTVLQATLSQYGAMHSFLQQEAKGIVTTERFNAKAQWLRGDGHMANKTKFAGWLASDDFTQWYAEAAGKDWEGERELSKLTVDQVRGIVELAFPMVTGKRTVYAEVNRGSQLLSTQMATLLKEGKLPDAEYRVDSMAVAPLE